MTEAATRTIRWTRQQRTLLAGLFLPAAALLLAVPHGGSANARTYPIVDTGQVLCYDNSTVIGCPGAGTAFNGQDAQHSGSAPSYTANANGTVNDDVTGLVWQASADTNADSTIDSRDKFTYTGAQSYCADLTLGGSADWRLPTIKQLYSLIDFRGRDPSGYSGTDTSQLTPFIDTAYFSFAYGDTGAGERIIDAQYASSTLYVAHTANDGTGTMFGVNFADGRIKGYGLTLFGRDKTFYVKCVRGSAGYGQSSFVDNGDGTITDGATGLMWAQNDSGSGMNWEQALASVITRNNANYLGHSDWRLPNAKELQSLVDYTRAPATTSSAAIDPLFHVTGITNEAGQADFPSYWSSTTHGSMAPTPGTYAVYVAFGRAMGYMNNTWVDVHGAGAQRSDPKTGNPADYPTGHGPQGDAIRIFNYFRLVRDGGSDTPAPTATVTETPQPTSTATPPILTPSITPTPPFNAYLPALRH